ncbi:MAG TPA: AAA family ATPase [Candidatus Dormibacteraeota bacterium]|nr:AAA family ATPase [Candidatus Dormibacteraeota bacterium]
MKTIAFFNNKGGVGKTSLAYHLSHMVAEMGGRVLCADLDPQANLSAMFVDEERLESIFDSDAPGRTIRACLDPILEGTGDIQAALIEEAPLSSRVGLIVGDIALNDFEDRLSDSWSRTLDSDQAALRSVTAFSRIVSSAAKQWEADFAFIDVGPNLGALNRAALIAADHVVIPLAPDLFSLRGLRNLGPTLNAWRVGWQRRLTENATAAFDLPPGAMRPLGYVVLQHAVRLDRPVRAYERWMARIPSTYHEYVDDGVLSLLPADQSNGAEDRACLATIKNYRSLMPLAQDARKPMFMLRAADGALGAQQSAVASCYSDFETLARRIAGAAGQALPESTLRR